MLDAAHYRRWERLRERREPGGVSRWLLALACGAALAALVWWRDGASVASGSHAWLAGTSAAFMLAFVRVPFLIYWRPDAALLAQLPIDGTLLFASALRRCIRAAAATTVVALVGAVPLALLDPAAAAAATRSLDAMPIAGDPVPRLSPLGLYGHHAAFAVAFGLVAACFIPAVTLWAASLVAGSRNLLHLAMAAGGAPVRAGARPAPPQAPGTGSAGAVLGALPGFASSLAVVALLLASPWLLGKDAPLGIETAFVLVGGVSVIAVVAASASIGPQMGTILRDVSALDRQRLATLEIHPLTAIERGVGALVGDAALAYSKDARLMRRRYPMAYALGALAFLVLAIVGLARPADPVPWLVATLAGGGLYAIALARRLNRPPIELPRLSATLPISEAARRRAKLAWLAAWVAVFLAAPTSFALLRTL